MPHVQADLKTHQLIRTRTTSRTREPGKDWEMSIATRPFKAVHMETEQASDDIDKYQALE